MTIPIISCEQFADGLADYLESDATGSRGAMEAHAAQCAECGALLADLRELRVNASALTPRVPERDLWAGIAARIETPVVEIASSGRLDQWTARRDRRMSRLWTGLAAAGLVAVTATVTHQLTKRSVAPAATVAATSHPKGADTPAVAVTAQVPSTIDSSPKAVTTAPGASLAANKLTPDQTYDAEITRLRAIVAQRRSLLDTATVNVIDRNLRIIDGAIDQCRQALLKDPASRYLMQSLNDALDTKIQLLRTAASLPSRA